METNFDAETKIWSGAKCSPVYHKDESAGFLFLEKLNQFSNKIVQINDAEETQLTGAELRSRAIKCAIHLRRNNIHMGDCVGIIARNSTNLAALVYASLAIGAPINPLDSVCNSTDIINMFAATKPKIIFFDHDLIENVKKALTELLVVPILVVIGEPIDGYQSFDDFFVDTGENIEFRPRFDNADKHPAVIACSSGTSGLSKGVMLSHAQVLDKTIRVIDTKCSDFVMLGFSSLHWLSGVFTLFEGVMIGATRIITTQKFSAELALHLITKYKVTSMFAPPSQIGLLLQHPHIAETDLSSLRVLMVGGSVVPLAYQRLLPKYLSPKSMRIGYGMTEIAGLIAYNDNVDKIGNIGLLAPGVSIKIIDEEGNSLGIEKEGEICIKTKYTFLGYCNKPEVTKDILDSDGWTHSGDIGRFDSDGYLYIVDRKKDIMKYLNYHVTPAELEDGILSIKGVQSVCVVGVPDEIYTDLPAALVVTNVDITEQAIIDYVAENMSDYKRLRGGVYFAESLPMTPSGKVQRNKVKEIAIRHYNSRKM